MSGARRWLLIGPLSVQPSEMFKLCFVLMAVWLVTSRWAQPVGKTALILAAPVALIPAVLIVKQPDLGTALLLFPVLIALFVAAGLRLRTLGGLVLAGVAALPLAWFAMKEYQRERILVFLDPFRDPLGSAYNVIQAKIAIGSGQLLGKGVAGATQSRLSFLPERHTDFIFAVFAETWGFVGCLVLLTCYALLLLRGFDIAASTREPVGRLVALGVTALVATQVIVNVGHGDRTDPCGRDSAAVHELRRLLDGRLHDGLGAPTLGSNAAVPMRRPVGQRRDGDAAQASEGYCREQAHRRQRRSARNPGRGPGA